MARRTGTEHQDASRLSDELVATRFLRTKMLKLLLLLLVFLFCTFLHAERSVPVKMKAITKHRIKRSTYDYTPTYYPTAYYSAAPHTMQAAYTYQDTYHAAQPYTSYSHVQPYYQDYYGEYQGQSYQDPYPAYEPEPYIIYRDVCRDKCPKIGALAVIGSIIISLLFAYFLLQTQNAAAAAAATGRKLTKAAEGESECRVTAEECPSDLITEFAMMVSSARSLECTRYHVCCFNQNINNLPRGSSWFIHRLSISLLLFMGSYDRREMTALTSAASYGRHVGRCSALHLNCTLPCSDASS